MWTNQPVQGGADPDSVVLRLFIRRSGKPNGVNRQRANYTTTMHVFYTYKPLVSGPLKVP